jgi:type I restriction enzyme S subunit
VISKRLKFCGRLIMGQSPSSEDYNQAAIGIPFIQGNAEFGGRHPSPKWFCDVAPKIAPAGSFLISVRAPVGALNFANTQYGIGRGLCAFVPAADEFEPSFAWWMLEHYKNRLLAQQTGSTYGAVSAHEVGNLIVSFPEVSNQRVIADFLDRETARIDEMIANKERLIELLDDRFQALVDTSVTGRQNRAKRRSAPLASCPDLPATWRSVRLRYCCSIQSGLTIGKRFDASQDLVDLPYLRVANVQDGFLDLREVTTVSLPPSELPRYLLQPGDVLMTEGGDFDKLGRGCVWEGKVSQCLHQNHVFAVRPKERVVDPYFLAYLTRSFHGKNHFTSTSSQTTNLATTNRQKLGDFVVFVPTLNEQRHIVRHLDSERQRTNGATQNVRAGLDKLREYRAALISAAVTGQIDVRMYRKESESVLEAT